MMKKLFISLALTAAAALSAQNVLLNPDFEEIVPAKFTAKLKKYIDADEVPKGWSFNPPSNPSKFTMVTDAETSQNGSCYLRVEQKDPKKNSSCSQWWRPVKGGQTYRFTVWAKGNGNLLLQVIAYDRKINVLGSFVNNRKMEKVSSAEEWKKYEYTFKMPEKTSKVVVHIKMNGVIDLDNAYLGPAEAK
ncbi:MAG: hypothetical protein E7040_00250 [Lentisphaerae bacterium]|nr:hypothetical protein [Lentisphaerota bacterium]